MSNKKKKSFSEKLNNVKPNSVIEFTAKDRADSWWNYEDVISRKQKEHLNFFYLILGLVFGICGSYISTQAYDFSKNVLYLKHGLNSFMLFNIFIWVLFGIIISIFVIKIIEQNKEIKDLRKEQERWSKAKNIHIGESYSPEYLEEFNEKINNQIKSNILEKINKKKFTISKFSRETNLSTSHIKRYLKELINENLIKTKGLFPWKRYFIERGLKGAKK